MRLQSALLLGSILSVMFGSNAMAQNKFLAPATVDHTYPRAVSCSAPTGMVAFASNLAPLDVYLARSGPSSDSDYINTFFELETQILLARDFMTTTDADVAEICNQLEQGGVSDELQNSLQSAIEADLLWWPINTRMGVLSRPDETDATLQTINTGYVSAKHVSFVSEPEWVRMTAPNRLGYLSLGDRYDPVPIASIEGIDTDNARAVAADSTPSVWACLSGFNMSPLLQFFATVDDGSGNPVVLPFHQTEFAIENGIWSDCTFDDEVEVDESELDGIPYKPLEYVANCPAKTIDGIEIDARFLPVSYGAMGGYGTNFALLCPAMTVEILQDDCDQGNEYSCDGLAEFLER
ncbi:hypothetical protein [Sulfitobacter litoralis]|uniref:hypothetical protein n=1 Tax=Sulfitobacter litoralis TaxID=335975 RepID=UPI0030EC9044|tara:strand:+ start:347 stop:1399 length:1053 start_codon:yes stop_codon:yes gene_type:complete